MNLAERYRDMNVFWAFDHSQLEIRVLAQMSGDKRLLELVQSEDIHSAVGHVLTGIPIEKIKNDRETRTTIKGLHFGIIYGLSPKSLFFKLKIEAAERKEKFTMKQEEVDHLYSQYFRKFGGVKIFQDEMIAFAEENEYVETLFGFKREIAVNGQEGRDTYWKNQAVNSPIQGTAHQLMLIALAVLEVKKSVYPLLQSLCMEVHDSLVGFGRLADLPEIYKQGIALLEDEVLLYIKDYWPDLDWKVPLKADCKAGFRMGVMVSDYKGGPVHEFIEQWCEKNSKFEEKLKKDIAA